MREILEASKPVIKAGKLGAQMGVEDCEYKSENGARCVVGTAMTDSTLAELKATSKNSTSIFALFREEIISGGSEEERDDINRLQSFHDGWARSEREHEGDETVRKDRRKRFYSFMKEMRNKYA
jgi:hypothetical protein